MFEFTDQESKLLRRLGNSIDGVNLIELLEKISRHVSDVDTISGKDYGAEVEGRKITKKLIRQIIDGMKSRQRRGTPQDDVDEWA